MKVRWVVSVPESWDIIVVFKILYYLSRKDCRCASIEEIVKNCRMSFATTRIYIPRLVDKGFVEVRREGRKKNVYLTQKGMEFIIASMRVFSILLINPDELLKSSNVHRI